MMPTPQRGGREEVELGTRAAGRGDAEEDEDAVARATSSHAGAGEEDDERGVEETASVGAGTTPTPSVRGHSPVGVGRAEECKESNAATVPAASDPPEDMERDESEGEDYDEEDEEEHEEFAAEAAAVTEEEEEEEEEGVSSASGSPDYIPLDAPGSPQAISAAEGLETTRDDDGSSCASGDGDYNDDFEFPSISCYRHEVRGAAAIHDNEGDRILVRRVYPVFDRELFRFYLDQASRDQQRREAAARMLGVGAGQEARKKKPGQRMALGRLMMEEEREPSTSSSEADDLEGLSPDSYCLWTPGGGSSGSSAPRSPRRRKSNSTGGGAGGGRKWRLRDLVIGRSHSDGKKKFLYLATEEEEPRGAGKERKGKDGDGKGKKQEEPVAPVGKKKKGSASTVTKKGAKVSAPKEEVDLVTTAHRRINHGVASAPPSPPPPLPNHRQKDILGGLFANVNGKTRSLLHPF